MIFVLLIPSLDDQWALNGIIILCFSLFFRGKSFNGTFDGTFDAWRVVLIESIYLVPFLENDSVNTVNRSNCTRTSVFKCLFWRRTYKGELFCGLTIKHPCSRKPSCHYISSYLSLSASFISFIWSSVTPPALPKVAITSIIIEQFRITVPCQLKDLCSMSGDAWQQWLLGSDFGFSIYQTNFSSSYSLHYSHPNVHHSSDLHKSQV